jgi:ferric-dicitrate binding protein FerR (iron transport regulator)
MTHHRTYPTHPQPVSQDSLQHDPRYKAACQDRWTDILNAGKTGATVGTAGAAAMNLHRMRQEDLSLPAALRSTARAGVNAGIATAAATAAGWMFRHHPGARLAATLATGTAVMYVLTRQEQENTDA